MSGAPDDPEDPVLEAELERALDPYRGVLPADLFAELRASLADALTTHPVGKALLDRVRPPPGQQKSGPRAKPGAEDDEPEAKGKAG
jgi:hypothetical protein